MHTHAMATWPGPTMRYDDAPPMPAAQRSQQLVQPLCDEWSRVTLSDAWPLQSS